MPEGMRLPLAVARSLSPGSGTLPVIVLLLAASGGWAVEPPPAVVAPTAGATGGRQLLTLLGSADGIAVAPSGGEVTLVRHDDLPGRPLELTVAPGADGHPGVILRPAAGVWDFSRSGRVDVRVANPWVQEIAVVVRVENGEAGAPGDQWNGESARIEPGGSGVVAVRFGYTAGKKGFALDPARITRVVVSIGKPSGAMNWRIDGVAVAGLPGEAPPEAAKLRLRDGIILGTGCAIDAGRRAEGTDGGVAAPVDGGLQIVATTATGGVRLAPTHGRWDLGDHLHVTVHARNTGTVPVALRVRLESSEGSTPWSDGAMLAAGAAGEVRVPFFNAAPWDATPGSGTLYASDATTGIAVQAIGEGRRTLLIDGITAGRPPAIAPPPWLGKRPPVPGDWAPTFDDGFDGTAIDPVRWSVKGENYNDKLSHFSADNVIVVGGVARLRFEKRRGHINDDPARPETDYSTGFLTGFGRWTQRYGYFEARMKVPTAPGLWPAFWMMPDRGPIPGMSNGKRGSTSNGGMEYDIMEYLTRYGSSRYNIALHWDDYGKDHRSVGNGRMYVPPDADGFITSGMLWEPGRLEFYGNGTLIGSWSSERIGSLPSHFLFTFTCGGWGGNDLDGTGLPDDFVIDWVRAWQRADLAALPPTPVPAPAPK